MAFQLKVNGQAHAVDAADDTPLLLSSDASLPFWDAAPDLVPAAGVGDLVLQAARVTGAAVPR